MNYPLPIVTFHQLQLGYGQGPQRQLIADALQEVVKPQELIALIGPNGTGKSTLLRTMARMQRPLAGEIRLAGKNMAAMSAKEIARHVSVVLTDHTDVGYVKAAEVVAMGRFPHTGWLGFLSPTDQRKVDRAIAQTRIEPLLDKPLHQLSDGERQKVMIARALAQDTPLMLLDEPTTHLDISNRVSIIQLLRSLVREARKTIILSTHDIELALQASDRLWLMHDRTIHSGAPEDLVLQGTLTRVMGSEQASFDSRSGTFRIQQPTRHPIALEGSGTAAFWTQRALERVGYQIQSMAPMTIRIQEALGEWQFSQGESIIRCHSIEELLEVLSKPNQTRNSRLHEPG